MVRVLLIDGVVSPELSGVLGAFANSKGKPLKVVQVPAGADLAAAQSYQLALRGASSRAALSECLLVVRGAQRAMVAAQVVQTLQLDDEAELPLLVAARITARANLEPALGYYLQARQAIELNAIANASAERIDFSGRVWRAMIGEELEELSGVLVPLTVNGYVTLRADGGVVTVTVSELTADEVTEARNFVASLVHHGQVSTHIQGQRARGTHEIIADAQGQRRLVRVRSRTR